MASTVLTDYVSQDVDLVWDGIPIVAKADTFVTVSFEEDHITASQGPDGFVSHSLLPATMGTIEVTLQQESETHALLTAVLAAQKEGRQIKRGTFLILNPNGNSLYTGINTCIRTAPTVTYGKTHEDGLRTWTFHAADLKLAG
jgi:hypothetical protein|tara:strand:+ start:3042 stop:3470 length:429 start_codon:yes stop_codon:yes gene_type:complete